MPIPLISHLGRSFSLANPFHQRMAATAVGSGLFLLLTQGSTPALAATLTLFMVWALTREVLPQHPKMALLLQLTYLFLSAFFPPILFLPLMPFAILLFCSRAVNGITGIQTYWYDWGILILLAFWSSSTLISLLIVLTAFILTQTQQEKSSEGILCDDNCTYQSPQRVGAGSLFCGFFLLLLIIQQIIVY